MAAAAAATSTDGDRSLSFDEVYDIVKRKEETHYDLVYRTLLTHSDMLTNMPNNETHSILHYLVEHGALELFNQILAIPNIRFILLTKTGTKPPKDVLQIATEKRNQSPIYKKLYETIQELVEEEKFVEYAKHNRIAECKQMLEQNPDLANRKPPYRKYYLIHHLAYANNQSAFDQLRTLCEFNMTLLTSDGMTASEVAIQQHHTRLAHHFETLSPEMRAIRERHTAEKHQQNAISDQNQKQIEVQLLAAGGNNMVDCFTCPLTKEIFQDPVVLCDGFTYERAAIQHWLDMGNRRSPMTNMDLASIDLVPNMVIKQALTELLQKQKKKP